MNANLIILLKSYQDQLNSISQGAANLSQELDWLISTLSKSEN